MSIKIFLSVFLMTPLALFAQADSTDTYAPVAYEGSVATSLSTNENYTRMLGSFKRSFGKYSGTKIEHQSDGTDSLNAVSKVNFVQNSLQSKEETRGAITFDIAMKADATGVHYWIHNFVHHGNEQARYGSKDFGELTLTTHPPKVAGISFKNRKQIWQELKDSVDVDLQKRIAEFEEQMQLDL